MRSARLPVHERLPIRENGERQLLDWWIPLFLWVPAALAASLPTRLFCSDSISLHSFVAYTISCLSYSTSLRHVVRIN